MDSLRKTLEKINTDACGDLRFDEPMSRHTTFRVGGPADAWIAPRSAEALRRVAGALRADGIPCVVLGGGANVLVADRGIRGVVLSTDGLTGLRVDGTDLVAGAGVPADSACRAALDAGLSGFEFAAGLPGSVGGAVYMNARCYDREIADLLSSVDWLDASGIFHTDVPVRSEWEYKRTPFMPGGAASGGIVVSARFGLTPGDPAAIRAAMDAHRADRVAKGHFDFPSAGSLFKNDRRFGRPTGKILDELGFRGRRIGDAMVSPKHANIFVNAGAATAANLRALITEAQEAARKAYGFELEPEVVFVGDYERPAAL